MAPNRNSYSKEKKIEAIQWHLENGNTVINPSHPNPGRREKIKLHFHFHTSLWCLKRLYEGLKGLKGLHKTF